MLLQLIVKNYRSIRDEVSFSFLASKDTKNQEQLITIDDKDRILKGAVLFGNTATGKTNLLQAFSLLQQNATCGNRIQSIEEMRYEPHVDLVGEPTELSVYFTVKDVMYYYFFAWDNTKITKEILYYWPNGKKVLIYERENNIFRFNNIYKKEFSEQEANGIDSFRPFIWYGAQYAKNEICRNALNWFYNNIKFHLSIDKNTRRLASLLVPNKRLVTPLIRFYNSIGFEVAEFRFEQQEIPDGEFVKRKEIAFVVWKNGIMHNVKNESFGFRWIGALFLNMCLAIKNEEVIVIDNIDSRFPYIMLKTLINRFLNTMGHKGQFLFTCYNGELLDGNILRRDQVWFADKDSELSQSEYYSLGDLNNVRKNENLRLGYLAGKYGSIPNIDESVTTIEF